MVDDPLRAYVLRCLAQGYTKQQIRERLLDAGYEMPEADSALEDFGASFSASPRLPASQQILLSAGVFAFVIIAASALVWLRISTPDAFAQPAYVQAQGEAPETSYPSPGALAPKPVAITLDDIPVFPARVGWPNRPVPRAFPIPPQGAYCADYTCLLAAIDACTPRQFQFSGTLDAQNVSVETTLNLIIGGPVDGGCTVWLSYSYQNLAFYDEYSTSLANYGLTPEQITFLQQEANAAAKKAMPAKSSCTMRFAAMRELFLSWQVGSYTAKPLMDSNCLVLYG